MNDDPINDPAALLQMRVAEFYLMTLTSVNELLIDIDGYKSALMGESMENPMLTRATADDVALMLILQLNLEKSKAALERSLGYGKKKAGDESDGEGEASGDPA